MATSTLTAEEITTYTGYLTEAESAYHKLMTGVSARVYVDQNGERVEYNLQSAAGLRGYIMHLRTLLGKPLHGIVGPMYPRMF